MTAGFSRPRTAGTRSVRQCCPGGPSSRTSAAARPAAPSRRCIPAALLDTPVDYDSPAAAGSIMGSGGMIVMDETTDMVDVARYFMEFCMDESCGKCVPCRVGTVQMYGLLQRLLQGAAGAEDLRRLETLCALVKDTSLCGLSQTAPNPTLSTLRYCRDEYEKRLRPGTPAQRLGLPVVNPAASS